jgi:hypothetical protein
MVDNGSISHNLHERSNHLCKSIYEASPLRPVAKKGSGITPEPSKTLNFKL